MSLGTDQVWDSFGASLRGFLARRAPADRVDDLLQEVFLRVHRGLDALRDDEHLAAWVHRIARNVLTDAYRAEGAGPDREPLPDGDTLAADDDDAGGPAGPGRTDGHADVAESVARMAERLPETFREAVRLAEIEGLPQKEVAERLGLSLSGAKSRIQRGRDHLRGMILQCCHVEFDRRRRPIALVPRNDGCPACCDEPADC